MEFYLLFANRLSKVTFPTFARVIITKSSQLLKSPMAPDKIKFGTDGWRAIIAQDFTVYNVARVSAALAKWLLQRDPNPRVVIGHDCRFGGPLFAETVAKVL